MNTSMTLLLALLGVCFGAQAGDLEHSKYQMLKRDFLNVSQGLHMIDFNAMPSNQLNTLSAHLHSGNNTFGLGMWQFGPASASAQKWQMFGVAGQCNNQQGDTAVCWKGTGGTRGGIFNEATKGHCGAVLPAGTQYTDDVSAQTCRESKTGWSSFFFWLGVGNNFNYVQDHFPNTQNKALNRLCIEMEWPENNIFTGEPYIKKEPLGSQFVNNAIHENLKYLSFELGTYTAPRTDANGATTDEEVGGTYQGGGSHFYHKPGRHAYKPTDKIYALDARTLVYCAGDMPTGVRSGMRPAYANNPLQGVIGHGADGKPLTPNYWNSVTRVYFQFDNPRESLATYPYQIKINKLWMLYEPNDIMLLTDQGNDVVSNRFVASNDQAVHQIMIHNLTNKGADPKGYRDYRLYVVEGGATPENQKARWMSVYIDNEQGGQAGVVDETDTEVKPMDIIRLPNGDSKRLLVMHRPDFNHSYSGTFTRFGRRVSQVKVGLQEIGRLRSGGITLRTWSRLESEQVSPAYEAKWFQRSFYRHQSSVALTIVPANGARSIKLALNTNMQGVETFELGVDSTLSTLIATLKSRIAQSAMKGKVEVTSKDGQIILKAYSPVVYALNGFELTPTTTPESSWFTHRAYNTGSEDRKNYLVKHSLDYIRAVGKQALPPSIKGIVRK